MKTTLPISTISFNSAEFLAIKLDELATAKILSFWSFIVHKPEDDEGGKKEHIHLYVEPAKSIQTVDLTSELIEFDPDHPEKPKKCISWVKSKFAPWYLYALHDKRYLASQGQSRRFHYSHDEILTSDPDDLHSKAKSIDMLSLSPYADMLEAQSLGLSWAEYFSRGTVPIMQIAQFERAWQTLAQTATDRDGRSDHPMDVDEESDRAAVTPSETPLKRSTTPKAKSDDELKAEMYKRLQKPFICPSRSSADDTTSWENLEDDSGLPF